MVGSEDSPFDASNISNIAYSSTRRYKYKDSRCTEAFGDWNRGSIWRDHGAGFICGGFQIPEAEECFAGYLEEDDGSTSDTSLFIYPHPEKVGSEGRVRASRISLEFRWME